MMGARAIAAALLAALALAAAPASAPADFGLHGLSFGFEEEDGSPATEAGTHPFAVTTTAQANTEVDPELGVVPQGAVKDLTISFPPGMVGNPTAVPPCQAADFIDIFKGIAGCPDSSALGTAVLSVGFTEPETWNIGVFNLEPSPGVAAKIGFVALGVPVTIDLGVNPSPPYNVIADSTDISQAIRFYGIDVSVWGNPVSAVHDEQRGKCFTSPEADKCPVVLPEKPFLTSPRSCSGPLSATFSPRSWQDPATWLHYEVATPAGMSGCSTLGFAPEISALATTAAAAAPSGLRFDLEIDDEGLTAPEGTAESDIKKAVVTLPAGMTVNPSVAEGLATCSEAELARESASSPPGAGCPQAAKVGAVEVETPILEGKLLHGDVFVATQGANPFGSLIALYMVIKDPELGILVKLPGRVDPHPATGQLVTTFGEPGFEVPQFPISHLRFRFREGARAPLITPRLCGRYETRAVFTPWANPAAPFTATASFDVTQGPGGGPCPGPIAPFSPGFEAGSLDNAAGAYSPFLMRLTRQDGEQDLTRFDAVLPPGVTGKIAGIPPCPEAAIAAAKTKSADQELAAPSCPEASRLGRTLAGAGAGSELTWVPGSLHLAGPYGGAPLSVVAITPAKAGPFDAGTVVVREALRLDPDSGEVIVDGAASDPIPHILEGIPLNLRELRVYADRPGFTLNPTSCDPSNALATLFGSFADPLSPFDDQPVSLAARYQAASCGALKFKPRLSLTLKGRTRRSANPALRAVFEPRPGDANLKGAVVTMPPSLFIDNAHIANPCVRSLYAAGACPKASILGRARAFTPLLDQPLEGPVYFRSNGGARLLPDVVADLGGQFDYDLVIAVLKSKNARIRAKVLNAPDAPVSKVVLNLQGGRRGLLENSERLCARKQLARLVLTAQNNDRIRQKSKVRTPSCKQQGKGRKQSGRHSRGR